MEKFTHPIPVSVSSLASVPMEHGYVLGGEIKVPSGQDDAINPFAINVPSGWSVKLTSAMHKLADGTSVTFSIQRNGSNLTGFTGLSMTQTKTETEPTAIAISDGDVIAPLVTAVSGTPQNGYITLFFTKVQL